MSMPPSSPAFLTLAVRFSARRSVKVSVSQAPATRQTLDRCATPTIQRARPGARPVAARHSSRLVGRYGDWRDQGGAIDPSSWCGIYGLKPTHGLVPYTGVFPIELTLTIQAHGPHSRCGLARRPSLGRTAWTRAARRTAWEAYTQALTGNVSGLRLGMVQEALAGRLSEPDVDVRSPAAPPTDSGRR
jgi:hypothetical protein